MSVYLDTHLGPYICVTSKVIAETKKLVCPNEHNPKNGGKFCSVCGAEMVTEIETHETSIHYGDLEEWGYDPDLVSFPVYPENSGVIIENTISDDGSIEVNSDNGGNYPLQNVDIEKVLHYFKECNADLIKILDNHNIEYEINYGLVISYS